MKSPILYLFLYIMLGMKVEVIGQGKRFGGGRNDIPTTITITENEHIILAGFSKSFDDGSDQVFILECDRNGNVIWEKTYGNIYGDRLFDICVNVDNSICLTGESWLGFDGQNGRENMFLVYLDTFGNILKQKNYYQYHRDMGSRVKQVKSGGHIVIGYTKSAEDKYGEIMIVRVNENLDIIWQTVLGEQNSVDYGFDIIENEMGFLVIGTIGGFFNSVQEDYRTELSRMYVAQISQSGELIWERSYGGEGHDWVEQGLIIDGDIYMVGSTQSIGNGSFDMSLFKINSNGDSLRMTTYGNSNYEHGRSILYNKNKLFLGGQKKSDIDSNNSAIYLVCTDLDGNIIWERTVEGTGSTKIKDMVLSKDGNNIFCLAQSEETNTQNDYWFFTLNSFGNFVSVSEIDPVQNMVYPNPVTSQANIKLSNNDLISVELFIYNQRGQLIQINEDIISSEIFSFSTTALMPGFYTYKLILGNERVITGKFIVH